MPITALPPAPLLTDTPEDFEVKAIARVVAEDARTGEFNALEANVAAKEAAAVTAASTATTQATAAEASNAAAAVNAAAAAASAGATVWVIGTTYAAGAVKYSPTNFQTYRDTVGGVSNTDPAVDVTGRWQSAMLPSAEAIGLPDMYPTAVLIGNGQIDRRLVQGRTTSKYRYNSFGNLEALPAGVSKVDFDPATKRCEGYKSEPATTYLAMRSSEMDNASYWPETNVTVTPDASIGADGALSSFKIEAAASVATDFSRNVAATSTSQYLSFRAKKGSGATDANKFVVFNATTATALASLTLNYDTGVVTQSVGSGATAAQDSNGAWLVRVPMTTGITISDVIYIYLCFVGDAETAGEHAYIDTPTLSDNPNATPHPTAGSNFSRGADNLVLDLTAHTDVVNPQGFTVVLAVDLGPSSASSRGLVEIGDGTSSNRFTLATSGSNIRLNQDSGGFSIASILLSYSEGRNVIAFSYDADGNLIFAASNQSPVSDSGASGAAPTAIFVGTIFTPGFEAGNYIEALLVYPRACTAGELVALTRNI